MTQKHALYDGIKVEKNSDHLYQKKRSDKELLRNFGYIQTLWGKLTSIIYTILYPVLTSTEHGDIFWFPPVFPGSLFWMSVLCLSGTKRLQFLSYRPEISHIHSVPELQKKSLIFLNSKFFTVFRPKTLEKRLKIWHFRASLKTTAFNL